MIIHSTTLDTMEKVIGIYGGTEWIQHDGYVLQGAKTGVIANSAVKTGGEATHVLTTAEMPSHSHSLIPNAGYISADYAIQLIPSATGGFPTIGFINKTNNTGGGNAHNIMQPYKNVYIWERTA